MLTAAAMQWVIYVQSGCHICSWAYDNIMHCSLQSIYMVIVVASENIYIYIGSFPQ